MLKADLGHHHRRGITFNRRLALRVHSPAIRCCSRHKDNGHAAANDDLPPVDPQEACTPKSVADSAGHAEDEATPELVLPVSAGVLQEVRALTAMIDIA